MSFTPVAERFSLKALPGLVESLSTLSRKDVASYVSGAVAAWMANQETPSIEQMQFEDRKGGEFKVYQLDIVGLDSKSRLNVVEVKSCKSDFTSDKKWQNYLKFADLYYFAVPDSFPVEILPDEPQIGLIVVSAEELSVMRHPKLAHGVRRYSLTLGLEKRALIKVEACLCSQTEMASRWMNGESMLVPQMLNRTIVGVGGKITELLDKWEDRHWSPIMYNKWLKRAGAGRSKLHLPRKVALRIRALMFIYQESYPPSLDGKRE